MDKREGIIERKTKETDITCTLNIDGTGVFEVDTGIGFFDHMLEGFARHGFFDLKLTCKGDLKVDTHHTVEDTGIVLGRAIAEAVGDKKGIKRYGHFTLPMDDALVICAVDLCGRPYLNYALDFPQETCGDMEMCMIREFFYAISYAAGMNIHLKQLDGLNSHHIAEAAFKAFAKALDMAVSKEDRIKDVLSTKGTL
ncbi:MAG: imidazoleglycerol-phosphate dehydratase HisB [Lachnospiraceae bacterium]|nr:imidazoleglycerol-phosphate dehydratase HisB [Lachnospiraceae bacterium]